MAARRPTLVERIETLEKRVVELSEELTAVREQLLKELARALHGPSQPPPPPKA